MLKLHEPQTHKEASTDSPRWQQAMKEELQAFQKTHNWYFVDSPTDKTLVGCKCIYKIKTWSDGSIKLYKAHLVAKGYTQEYGNDYEETFDHAARTTSVRTLLAIVAAKQWRLHQMDVKNAFLNGDLEEVYVQPPPSYDHPPNEVWHLRRALYGLKQSPRARFAKFNSTLSKIVFSPSLYDNALFSERHIEVLFFYFLCVDDMIITGDDLCGFEKVK